MSNTHDIDNDEQVFQFDSFDDPLSPPSIHRFPSLSNDTDPSARQSPPSRYQDPDRIPITHDEDKGKSVSQPVPIRNGTAIDLEHDVFDFSLFSSASSPHQYSPPPIASSSSFDSHPLHSPLDHILQHILSLGHDTSMQPLDRSSLNSHHDLVVEPFSGKGKGRELPPSLPPLTFSPTELGYGNVSWPSPDLIAPPSGPSSYGSGYGSPPIRADSHRPPPSDQLLIPTDEDDTPLRTKKSHPTVRRMPSRRRSLSSLSIHSARSIAARSVPRIKGYTSKVPDTLARKLLFRKRRHFTDDDDGPPDLRSGHAEMSDVGQGNCLMPWRGDLKYRRPVTLAPVPYSSLKLDFGSNLDQPTFRRNNDGFRVKSRSYSSPLPLSSVDTITPVCVTPIPVIARNHFDELPRELRLNVISSLLVLHETEYERYKAEGKWSVLKASSSKGKWVGTNRGIRELVKLSRVSKSWHALVFDGQLWINLDLRPFPKIPASLILRLVGTAGTFVQSLNLMGHGHLLSTTLSDVTTYLCLEPAPLGNLSCTQLTSVNLQGCSGLTTRSLHHLLIRSPSLLELSLKGLSAVTNTTCDVLAAYCPQLTSLNLSRCLSMDGSGILSLASAAISRGERLLLKELRLSGLKLINDAIMATLGKAAPYLEILDLSYVRQLHNSALEAFVSCDDGGSFGTETILLTSREAGREPGSSTHYRRRITRLRHLCLSSCVLLTDIACSNLAYTMPHLEFLEMAGIGAELKDEGLIRLLNTTRFIRKLDLEDASEITDGLIAAITPSLDTDPPLPAQEPPEPETGHALEHLIISFATNVSDNALLSLIRGCPRLRVLEADNTHMSGLVLKEFVRCARERGMTDSGIVAIDCRGISETLVKDLAPLTRPRLGWRSYHARKLKYLDGRDKEELKVGQDECDETRVVLKSFFSWQTVDAVKAAREKRRKSSSRRAANDSNGSVTDSEDLLGTTGRARWWSPGSGRRVSGGNSPTMLDTNSNEGCRIM